MKKFFLFLLLLTVAYIPTVAGIDSPTLKKGPVVISINLGKLEGRGEYNRENLKECLINHLDYYFWMKGWDYNFVSKGDSSATNIDLEKLQTDGYSYLIDIETGAEFHAGKVPYSGNENKKKDKIYNGFLKIRMKVRFFDLMTSKVQIMERKADGKARDEWVEDGQGGFFAEELSNPESPDFVIKRMLSKLFDFLPSYPRKTDGMKSEIPLYLVVDKNLLDSSGNLSDDLMTGIDYASHGLRRQFGFGLKLTGLEPVNADGVAFADLKKLYRSFLKGQPDRNDTITVAVIKTTDPEKFYIAGIPTRIGLSDMGKRMLMVADLSEPNGETSEWKAFLNGQLLLHETGHLLGAIHVSDIRSIMNPQTAWVSPYRFDRFNSSIITRLKAWQNPPGRVSDYLDTVVVCLEDTEYKLADYPATFFSYVNLNRRRLGSNSFGSSGVGKSILYALEGYQQYLLKDRNGARDVFYMALASESTQGAIHYYLSQVTDGKLSELHLRESAKIGYYMAIDNYYQYRK